MVRGSIVGWLSATPMFVGAILLAVSISPMYNTSWIYGTTILPIQNCDRTFSCINGGALFQVLINPFYASMLYNQGTLAIQSVPWTSLNTKDVCTPGTRLYNQYALPNNLCDSTGQFVYPSLVNTIQALAISAIVLGFFSIFAGFLAAGSSSRPTAAFFYLIVTVSFCCAVATLGVWNTFPVQANYLNGKATTAPVYNATLVYSGQVAIRGKYTTRYEDVYTYTWTDTLVGTPSFLTPQQSSGYWLWISGIVFFGIAQLMVLMSCCGTILEDSRSDGSFGSGVFRQPTRGNNEGFTSLDAENPPPSYIPPASIVERPAGAPPPPPPEYFDDPYVKKEW